jgi:dihydropteroate synthase
MLLSEFNFPNDRPVVMGILNITPDSFADGGRFEKFELALKRGLEMLREGVDIIDVGGESTRPGSHSISSDEELRRVIPVIEALSSSGAVISIDTKRAETARMAIRAGAHIVNDVSAGLADPEMLSVVAALACPFIAMHTRGESAGMQLRAVYDDVVDEVGTELQERAEASLAAGILPENLILDPGIGFAKESEHNWRILNHLEAFTSIGYPILIGASRKRFLGKLVGAENTDERESATIALTALLAKKGIWGVRVHSVKPHLDAIAVARSMR